MSYYRGWAPYVPAAERRRRAVLAMAKLSKKGHPVAPVVIEGRAIVTTFWGKAWSDNLESYHDFENRLPRGRTYVRNGSVLDLQIAPREVTAMVSGSSIYKITVSIDAVPTARWKSICKDCAGGIDSLVELLEGRLSQGVMERVCRQGLGLFPGPREIRFKCSCPDYASMCKHVAAVLYGVGARLDAQPELLFRLRAVDEKDLVTGIDEAIADDQGRVPQPERCWRPTICRRCSGSTWRRTNHRRQSAPLRSVPPPGRLRRARKARRKRQSRRSAAYWLGWRTSQAPPCAVPGFPPAIRRANCSTPRTPARPAGSAIHGSFDRV